MHNTNLSCGGVTIAGFAGVLRSCSPPTPVSMVPPVWHHKSSHLLSTYLTVLTTKPPFSQLVSKRYSVVFKCDVKTFCEQCICSLWACRLAQTTVTSQFPIVPCPLPSIHTYQYSIYINLIFIVQAHLAFCAHVCCSQSNQSPERQSN